MEDLAQKWKTLSLSEVEDTKVDLSRGKKKLDFVLAAKFFTHRSLNIEAVVKTFQPLWRTRGYFEVSDGGDNILLLAFEMDVDAEKVMQGAPWAFDRHLVVFQRYNGVVLIQDLCFDKTAFWIQLHNLPFSVLTIDTALSIGETIGTITKPKDVGEMKGGSFMKVQVEVDISKPLCRGRKISWDQNSEGWVAFQYERLLNICYWCELVSHDDKDCVLWLSSRGTLTVDEQQFGPWIRAPQFNPTRKTIVEVKGFDSDRPKSSMAISRRVMSSRIIKPTTSKEVDCVNQEELTMNVAAPMEGLAMEDVENDEDAVNGATRITTGNQVLWKHTPVFEEVIRDNDRAINAGLVVSNLKVNQPDPTGLQDNT